MADNTANIGFEKQIWDAACVLRGNIDASEYKSVVLGLIFLKYISDRFDEKYQQLMEEGDGFEEDVDEYISEGIFFVPETARWSVIASKAHTPEIGTVMKKKPRSCAASTVNTSLACPSTASAEDWKQMAYLRSWARNAGHTASYTAYSATKNIQATLSSARPTSQMC